MEDKYREIEVVIDTEEIAEYFYVRLVEHGLAVKEDDLAILADITFDYFIDKGVVEEADE